MSEQATSIPRDWRTEHAEQRAKERNELKAVQTFHEFLQGVIPKEVSVRKIRKMNPDQAMTVIWFLQEVCKLLDGRFEMCHTCNVIYDSYTEGVYIEKTGQTFCDSCDPRP